MWTIFGVIMLITFIWVATNWIAENELKGFRLSLSPGDKVIVEIDDERYVAFVEYVRYNDYIETSYCTVKALITEQYIEIQVELKNIYPYEEIA